MEAAVIIPTYNEHANLGSLLPDILAAAPELHIIVVDDGSADGTPELVQSIASAPPGAGRVHLIERGRKLGYASAAQDGMRHALAAGARLVLQMDGDFSHDPSYLPAILRAAQHAELIIGSRYVKGGGTRNWGPDRKILSGGANWLVRRLLALPVHDCTGGFRCWRRELVEKSGVLDLHVEGYAFLFLTLERCCRLGATIAEVPIIFVDRQYGHSKMSRRIIMEAVRVLFKMWRRRCRRQWGPYNQWPPEREK